MILKTLHRLTPWMVAIWVVLLCVSRAQRRLLAVLGTLGIVALGLLVASEFDGVWQRIATMLVVLINLGIMYRYRRIVVRWERYPENFLAMLHLASAIILLRHL